MRITASEGLIVQHEDSFLLFSSSVDSFLNFNPFSISHFVYISFMQCVSVKRHKMGRININLQYLIYLIYNVCTQNVIDFNGN